MKNTCNVFRIMSLAVIICVLFAVLVFIPTTACTIEQAKQDDFLGDNNDITEISTESPSTTPDQPTNPAIDYYARDGDINNITHIDIHGDGNNVTINNYNATPSTSSPSDTFIALGLDLVANIIAGVIITIFECFWKKRH